MKLKLKMCFLISRKLTFSNLLKRIPCLAGVVLGVLALISFAGCSKNESIHEAARNGDLRIAKSLLTANPDLVFSRDVNSICKETNNIQPLVLALANHHTDVAGLLLANHADPNIKFTDTLFCAITPLHMAMYCGYYDEAELLLKYHADINAKDSKEQTPLHFAAQFFRKDLVKLLLANKAEVDPKDNKGNTPLHLAATMGPVEQVELLIAYHADINATNNNGQTPLHLAVENKVSGIESAKLLMASGADANIKDNTGQTPLQLAESFWEKSMVQLLRTHNGH